MSKANTVTINKGQAIPAIRSAVAFGQTFSYIDKKGSPKADILLAVGASDRLYAIKASNGELAGTDLDKGHRAVVINGAFEVKIKPFKDNGSRQDFRARLQPGDVYRVQRIGAKYLHLGELVNGRYLALNLDSDDYATTTQHDKEVTVVGFGQFIVRTVG
jgi:hypothetical protein